MKVKDYLPLAELERLRKFEWSKPALVNVAPNPERPVRSAPSRYALVRFIPNNCRFGPGEKFAPSGASVELCAFP